MSETQMVLNKISETSFSNITYSQVDPYLDLANGHIGLISGGYKDSKFQLLDSIGKEIFTVKPKSGKLFRVEMSPGNKLIFLTNSLGEGMFQHMIYDYSGQLVLTSMYSSNVLVLSPGGVFIHSINDSILTDSRPEVFDLEGSSLVKFHSKSGMWQLTALNDSVLLFQDENRIKILSIPSLIVKNEFEIQGVSLPNNRLVTTKSQNGGLYAFAGLEKIVIYNINNNEVFYVSKERIDGLSIDPILVITPNERKLICYYKSSFQYIVYENNISEWNMVSNSSIEYSGKPLMAMYRSAVISNEICAINYIHRSPAGMAFRALIINIDDMVSSSPEKSYLNGMVSETHNIHDKAFHLLTINYPHAGDVSFSTYKLKNTK